MCHFTNSLVFLGRCPVQSHDQSKRLTQLRLSCGHLPRARCGCELRRRAQSNLSSICFTGCCMLLVLTGNNLTTGHTFSFFSRGLKQMEVVGLFLFVFLQSQASSVPDVWAASFFPLFFFPRTYASRVAGAAHRVGVGLVTKQSLGSTGWAQQSYDESYACKPKY